MAEKPVKEMDKHDSAITGEQMGIRHIQARVYAADAVCDAYGEDEKGGKEMRKPTKREIKAMLNAVTGAQEVIMSIIGYPYTDVDDNHQLESIVHKLNAIYADLRTMEEKAEDEKP